MGSTRIIGMLNAELGHSSRGTSTDALNERNALILKLLTTLEAHNTTEETILRDEARSQAGKLEALKQLGAEKTAPSLKWLKNVIQDREATDQGHRKRFFTVDAGIANIAERMAIFGYLWLRFDALDPSARVTQFAHAAEQDQVRVLAGMLEHPLGALVNDDVKLRVLTDRARRLFAQPYAQFEQNAALLEFLTMVRDWLGRWLALEVRVELAVIRTNLGDAIADILDVQTRTGFQKEPELVATT